MISRKCHQNCAAFGKLLKSMKRDGEILSPTEFDMKLSEMKKLDVEFQTFPDAERVEAINFYLPGQPKPPALMELPSF